MPRPVRIDFVSDVVCPWCVIGLMELEQALRQSADAVTADIHFQPFELNPDMPPGGASLAERLASKYGMSPEEIVAAHARMRSRAAEVGFDMRHRERTYNTFNAHRLLHWARLEGRQTELKHALFAAYYTRGESLDDAEVLAGAAQAAGLDGQAAREVLSSDRYAEEVRAAEQHWRALGVNSVPSIIIEGKHLISGGQPAAVFEDALRKIAAEAERA